MDHDPADSLNQVLGNAMLLKIAIDQPCSFEVVTIDVDCPTDVVEPSSARNNKLPGHFVQQIGEDPMDVSGELNSKSGNFVSVLVVMSSLPVGVCVTLLVNS